MSPDDSSTGLPKHPETNQPDEPGHGTGARWGTVLVLVLVGALLVTIVVLHLTGVVGPAGHG
jgi:hypothetical protein